jgi:hypothetical protein
MEWGSILVMALVMSQVSGSLSDQEATKKSTPPAASGSLSDSNSGSTAAPASTPATGGKALLPDVRNELLSRVKKDQVARTTLIEWMKQTKFSQLPKPIKDQSLIGEFKKITETMAAVDQENLEFLKRLVEKHGWLSRTLVSADGAKAAWLMLQHADSDREFQKKCLEMMKGLPAGEVEGKDIAYLTDRILVNEGQPQIYGTQIKSSANGGLELAPLFEPEQVDERRKKMGLGPIEEYLSEIRKQFGP